MVNYAFLLNFRTTAVKCIGMSELCLCWSDIRLLASLCHHHFMMFGGMCCCQWHPMVLWYLWNKGDFILMVFLLKAEMHSEFILCQGAAMVDCSRQGRSWGWQQGWEVQWSHRKRAQSCSSRASQGQVHSSDGKRSCPVIANRQQSGQPEVKPGRQISPRSSRYMARCRHICGITEVRAED